MTSQDMDLQALTSAAAENNLDRLQKELDKWLHNSQNFRLDIVFFLVSGAVLPAKEIREARD